LTRCSREKNFLIPAAAGFFSLDATSGLLATRRRLGRWGGFSAMRSAFVVSSCMYEEFTIKKIKKNRNNIPRSGFASSINHLYKKKSGKLSRRTAQKGEIVSLLDVLRRNPKK